MHVLFDDVLNRLLVICLREVVFIWEIILHTFTFYLDLMEFLESKIQMAVLLNQP